MRIAVDFDETIFNKKTGEIIDGAAESINDWVKQGHEITIFTNRPDWDYSSVKAIMDLALIDYDRIICGKPGYDILIDDKAARFEGWDKEYV